MAHRDELEALRARLEALEDEREDLVARVVEAERARAEAEARIDELERGASEAARLGARAAAAERARREADERADRLRFDLERARQGDDDAFPSRTAERRLDSALRFAGEGRGREALQIVLSVERTSGHPRAKDLLARRVWCVKERTRVRPPDEPDAHARFARGRCPGCGTLLELEAP